MATYLELHALASDSDLQDKIAVAVIKKAQSLLVLQSPTTAQVGWASNAIKNPKGKSKSLINYVLAINSSLDTLQIQGVTDAAIQTNIDAAVDTLIAGGII